MFVWYGVLLVMCVVGGECFEYMVCVVEGEVECVVGDCVVVICVVVLVVIVGWM